MQTESKRDLGSAEQAFVDRLIEEMSAFLLGAPPASQPSIAAAARRCISSGETSSMRLAKLQR